MPDDPQDILRKLVESLMGDSPEANWSNKLREAEGHDDGRRMSVMVEIPANMPRMALEGPVPDNDDRRGIVFPGIDYSCAGVMYGEYKIHVSANRHTGALHAEIFKGTELLHNIVVTGNIEQSNHAALLRKIREKTLRWRKYKTAFLSVCTAFGVGNLGLAIVYGAAINWAAAGWVSGFLTFVALQEALNAMKKGDDS